MNVTYLTVKLPMTEYLVWQCEAVVMSGWTRLYPELADLNQTGTCSNIASQDKAGYFLW